MQTLVSVIVPTYNYARYLSRALDSVLCQRGGDYEIVVVDDGSTDRTAEIVHNYQARRSQKIRYVFQENQGPGAARNHGVGLAAGQYVLFLDGDDALLPEAMDRFRKVLSEGGHFDFVWGGSIRIELDGRVERTPFEPLSTDRAKNFLLYLRKGPGMIYPGTFLIRRAVFDRIQWPETTYIWADVVFYSHLLALYDGIGFLEPVVTIHKRGDSLQHNLDLIRRDRLKTVDLLFDLKVLPAKLMPFREEYLSRTLVSLIKLCYERGRYREALQLSHQAFRTCPRYLLRLKHLRRYRRIVQKLAWQRIVGAHEPPR